MPLENQKTRQLATTDLVPRNEFTLALASFATKNNDSIFTLRVGDVIKIHNVTENGIYISVNGHFKTSGDRLFVPSDEISNFTVVSEE